MSSSSKRSCAPVATAPRFPFPPLAQLCLNELLAHDGDLARYLQQDSLLARGKLQSHNVLPPPGLYRDCSYALEDLYAKRQLLFSLPELVGQTCQHPRCQLYGKPARIYGTRYLQWTAAGFLIWRCNPEQAYSGCRWVHSQDLMMRRAGVKRFNILQLDLERPSGI